MCVLATHAILEADSFCLNAQSMVCGEPGAFTLAPWEAWSDPGAPVSTRKDTLGVTQLLIFIDSGLISFLLRCSVEHVFGNLGPKYVIVCMLVSNTVLCSFQV